MFQHHRLSVLSLEKQTAVSYKYRTRCLVKPLHPDFDTRLPKGSSWGYLRKRSSENQRIGKKLFTKDFIKIQLLGCGCGSAVDQFPRVALGLIPSTEGKGKEDVVHIVSLSLLCSVAASLLTATSWWLFCNYLLSFLSLVPS